MQSQVQSHAQSVELVCGAESGGGDVSPPFPIAAAEFDAFVARERFVDIMSCEAMRQFLQRAQARFNELNASPSTLAGDQMKAWQILAMQFDDPNADLRPFFTEIDEFRELDADSRRGLITFADGLVAQPVAMRLRG